MIHDCDVCHIRPINGGIRSALCPGCGRKSKLCRAYYTTWIACSGECRVKWRKEASEGLPKEKLLPPMNARRRLKKGYENKQIEFEKVGKHDDI